ncbi:CHAT domain-containing protein [Herbidospora mongoliensis]|uniref:CHAT domain-containing protein n=1 Tax=Herbidospora mongoliensis TaxID=688067 RepID=UPI00083111F4|nr:CHAT domain-containing tetratricopeptide repeat protein [Herbidospora mongoliensis]
MTNGSAELLPLALSRPHLALEQARKVLARDPSPFEASVARQAVGIVLREFGDIDAAVRELRTARHLARLSRSADREADVLASLGVALVFAGRTAAGRQALDLAVLSSVGWLRGRSLLRRGGVLVVLGAHREALADLNDAIEVLHRDDDRMWEARALTERAFCHLALGAVREAADDLGRAEEMFRATGQELESADAVVHRGVLALRIGDLPEALACFDAAADRFDRLEVSDPALSLHRCRALLTAGLADEALIEADSAIDRLEGVNGQPAKVAELMLMAAECALAADRPQPALARAATAVELFEKQHRPWWRAHARLVLVRAEFAAGPPTAGLLATAAECTIELAGLSSPDLPLSRLVAGRLALALGRASTARHYLTDAARARWSGPAQTRTVGWLAEALLAETDGDARRLMRACRRGLAVIEEHRDTLGSSELLAQATTFGAQLAGLGQRHALELDRPRLLLTWCERWRAGALAIHVARSSDDEALQADLAAVRVVSSRLADVRAQGLPTAALHAEQLRLERAARARALRTRAPGRSAPLPFDVSALLAKLGDDTLLELVDVDGELHVLLCGSDRVRRFPAGRLDRAVTQIHGVRFGLSRLAHGRSTLRPDEILGQVDAASAALERTLFGDAMSRLGDGDVIVVPPGRLHAAPWALLPALRDRVLSVAPSATSWSRARDSPGGGGDVVLVRGPGLASGGEEVVRIAADYVDHPPPVVLGDGGATVARVLAAMDGAGLAHIAAHGTFRADSPQFSALRVDDGPLMVYDLERLHRPPRHVILSSCDSGRVAAVGSDELLGLAASLIQLGTAGIVASVAPVNDRAAVPLMVALHRELRAGSRLPEALRAARLAVGTDPVALATGWCFLALGSG